MNWKLFFLPVSMVLSFLYAYFGIMTLVLGLMQLFWLDWYLVLLFSTLIIFVAIYIVYGLPKAFRNYSISVYGTRKLPHLLHALSSAFGFFMICMYYLDNPVGVEIDGEFTTVRSVMWIISPLKAIFFLILLSALSSGLVWNMIILPLKKPLY